MKLYVKFYITVTLLVFSFLSCTQLVNCGNVNFAETAFVSVWNSPSEVCDKRGVPLNLSYFDIVANSNDTFEGNEIVIFYEGRLGLYPRIDADGKYIHGGLPQLANITEHLNQMSVDVVRYIPNDRFTGLAVIDWESWRPIFDRNGYNQEMKIYIQASKSLVRRTHPDWSEDRIENEARKEFEISARKFMQSTLDACRKLRPGGQWGFYGFPNCYNHGRGQIHCSNNTMVLNDRLGWLFRSSTSLFPSIYLEDVGTHTEKYDKVYGQLKEALRLKKAYGAQYLPIFAYTKYKYADTGHFYGKADLNNTIRQVAEAGINGVALWGSSASFRSATYCKQLRDYIDSTLGPFVKNITQSARKCSQELCNSHGRCVNTEWKRKSVATEKLFFKSTVIGFLQMLLEELLDTLNNLYHAHWKAGRADESATFVHSWNGAASNANISSGYSCVCFEGWTGQFCQRQI